MNSPRPFPARRTFLLSLASTGAAALVWKGMDKQQGRLIVTESAHALGARVTMTALHDDEATARRALRAAFAELERVEAVMSLYRHDSQISRLNREHALDQPDPYLVEVVNYAAELAARTQGAFDITVQPLWALYAEARHHGRLPEHAAIRAALDRVGWRNVRATAQRIELHGAGVAITLNGIAQGFAADAAMRALATHGVQDALIDTGELSGRGHNAEGAAWSIGIQHPRQKTAFAALAKLENRCLATSGDYETTFSEDYSHHHIFDPVTGQSPGELASVSVLAPTALQADALSTALFVMGADRGLAFLQSFPDTDVLLISKNGQRRMTAGFPAVA
ncbi:MAG: FAD:protein FMN transferase [Roseimicrobium sp.]